MKFFHIFVIFFTLFALPNYFGSSRLLPYGVTSLGPRRVELMNRYWATKLQAASSHPRIDEWSDIAIDKFKVWLDIELDIYYFAVALFWKRIKQYSVERYMPEYDASSDFDLGDTDLDSVSGYLKSDPVINSWMDTWPSAKRNIFQEWKYDTTTTTIAATTERSHKKIFEY